MFSETLSAHLFKAENFPHSNFKADDTQGRLLEWADWEVEKVTGSLSALSSALSASPETRKASLLDKDMIGLLTILEGRLRMVGAALKAAQGLESGASVEL